MYSHQLEFAVFGLGYLFSAFMAVHTSLVVGVAACFGFSIVSGISPKLRVVKEQYSLLQVRRLFLSSASLRGGCLTGVLGRIVRTLRC